MFSVSLFICVPGDAMDDDLQKKINTVSIRDLNLDIDVRLRRRIERAGFNNILALFSLSADEIDEKFDFDDADEIIELQKRFNSDPGAFFQSALSEKKVDREKVDQILSKQKVHSNLNKSKRAQNIAQSSYRSSRDGGTIVPPESVSGPLKDFESRASSAFISLFEECETVMIYQAYDEFATELDDIASSFKTLFDTYSSQHQKVLEYIQASCPNAFLIYVAHLVRESFDSGNLWVNLFDKLGITADGIRDRFKKLFMKELEDRGMRTYGNDEKPNYIFYTALLHGGLSRDAWESLWPVFKDYAKDVNESGRAGNPRELLDLIRNREKYCIKKTVLNILNKAPSATIAPLFGAAIGVANQVNSQDNSEGTLTMLTDYGLPEVAIEALSSVTKRGGKGGSSYFSLPQAHLQLDPYKREVAMIWGKRLAPIEFKDNCIEYYVNGKLEKRQAFYQSNGKCMLDEVLLNIGPHDRYEVELKLMELDEEGGWREISSTEQSIVRNKPKCFEFKLDQGAYRLRSGNRRIKRKTRIAYIVKEGFEIKPAQGMKCLEVFDSPDEAWSDSRIQVFELEPGASGSIVESETGRVVSVWHEMYSAKIDKRRIIGETLDGTDVYGFAPNELGLNGGLPTITIQAADGESAFRDIDVECRYDGGRTSIKRMPITDGPFDDSIGSQIVLSPAESMWADKFVDACTIKAFQKSNKDKPIFKYEFTILPIRGFRLTSASVECGIPVAIYWFQVIEPLEITDTQGETQRLGKYDWYSAKTLLKDEFLKLGIHSPESGKTVEVKLALAGIDLQLPVSLAERAQERPLCLADALDSTIGSDSVFIQSRGMRYNRAVVAFLGDVPIFFKEMKREGRHSFDVLNHKELFKQLDCSLPNEFSLRLSVLYGDKVNGSHLLLAQTDIDLFPCISGLGFSSWRLLSAADGGMVIRFDKPFCCDAHIAFVRGRINKSLGEASILNGEYEAIVPEDAKRSLLAQKKVVMVITPEDCWGELEEEYAARFEIGVSHD